MVPVAVDGLVAVLEDGIDLVAGVELVVEAVLAVEDDDEADILKRPNDEPNQVRWWKLDRSESGMARFNPLFQSMITGDSSGDVDGLVVLEIGRKEVAKEAQSNDVAVLGPTDGWAERVDNNDNALLSQTAQLAC